MARRASKNSGCAVMIIAIPVLFIITTLFQGILAIGPIFQSADFWYALGGLVAILAAAIAVYHLAIQAAEHRKICRARLQAKAIIASAQNSKELAIAEAKERAAETIRTAERRAIDIAAQSQQQSEEVRRTASIQAVETERRATEIAREAEKRANEVMARAHQQSGELLRKASLQVVEAGKHADQIVVSAKRELDAQMRRVEERANELDARETELRMLAISLHEVDSMAGPAFETYVARLLEQNGYRIEQMGGSGDLGCDLIAEQNGKRWAIQCKRQEAPVSRRAVSDALGAKTFYRCDSALVITNNWFTPDAKKMAEKTNCVLADRDQLSKWIQARQTNEPRQLVAVESEMENAVEPQAVTGLNKSS